MNTLILLFSLNISYLPVDDFLIYSLPSFQAQPIEFAQDMKAELVGWDFAFLGGELKVYDWFSPNPIEGIGFWPFRGAFLIYGGLRYRGFELKYSHYCTHPIFLEDYIPGIREIMAGGYGELSLVFSGQAVLLQ